ncbi:MAG: molybdopterin-guanine dinucleotide biosynthesis protein MobA [Bacteroidetes bacterium]|nr:MAG: molybdopterin-guanine dinucleotide biosynthesis protein MobA [Bacteroidota bacterium]
MNQHQKHVNLARPRLGHYARNEWAILGTPCGEIKQLAFRLTHLLSPRWRLAYLDADHRSADAEKEEGQDPHAALTYGASMNVTDKINFWRFDFREAFNPYQVKALFNEVDVALINGNHFEGQRQIVVVDRRKPLEKKLHKLSNVDLIVLQQGEEAIPTYLQAHLEGKEQPAVLHIQQTEAIAEHLRQRIELPPVKGLVLAGGRSTRMKRDKGLIAYHGKAQREYAAELLRSLGLEEVFISCREDQQAELAGSFPTIADSFMGLGPFGGICSAFRQDPNAAWLVIACDLPFLSAQSLGYLLQHRNASRIATTFQSPANEFPEPLITLWEPRSYPVLLHFLSMGYSCPRKVLINSRIELLQAPKARELTNVNEPDEYEAALRALREKG